MLTELKNAVSAGSLQMTQQQRDYDTRYCLWDGQTDDGRTWEKKKGKGKAFPWDGASDARVPYVDGIIGEQVRTNG